MQRLIWSFSTCGLTIIVMFADSDFMNQFSIIFIAVDFQFEQEFRAQMCNYIHKHYDWQKRFER